MSESDDDEDERPTNAIIRNSATGELVEYYDDPDKGREALAEMVRKDPSSAHALVLVFYRYGEPLDAIVGDELLADGP